MRDEIDKLAVNTIQKNSEDSYIFEVDLKYAQELHDLLNKHPL